MRGALLIVATAVAACGPTPQELTARQLTTFAAQRDGKIEICKQTFPADKPLSPRIACINNAVIEGAEDADKVMFGGHQARARSTAAQIALAAERYDAGKITRAEFDADMSKAVAAAVEEERRVAHDAQMASAAQTQADAQANMHMLASQKRIMDAARGRY